MLNQTLPVTIKAEIEKMVRDGKPAWLIWLKEFIESIDVWSRNH